MTNFLPANCKDKPHKIILGDGSLVWYCPACGWYNYASREDVKAVFVAGGNEIRRLGKLTKPEKWFLRKAVYEGKPVNKLEHIQQLWDKEQRHIEREKRLSE